MHFIDAWATSDQRILLSLGAPALTSFKRHIQRRPADCEAGGILLGTIHGLNIAVADATEPTIADKRLRYFFERMPFGHKAVALKRWRSSGGTMRYLGEWHTHPQDFPKPSSLDRAEWHRLSRKRADERPMLAIIVGRKSLYVELVPRVGIGQVMVPIDEEGMKISPSQVAWEAVDG